MVYKNVGFKVFFFIGKGGVGKTTCAAAFAVKVARYKRTLIISLDPAHNLGDVLGVELSEKPTRVVDNLFAVEVDFESMIRSHLENLVDKVKGMYRYLRVLNLDSYIDVLRYSPGIEEYATLDKITEVLKWNISRGEYEVIVFDTPPTGLTLRIMALPSISSIWVDKLMKLRIQILDRRRIIEKITGEKIKTIIGGRVFEAPSKPEDDPVYNELVRIKSDINLVNSIVKNPATTTTVIVVNPETLPIVEAKRALNFLGKLGIPVKYIIVNKVLSVTQIPENLKPKIEEQERALRMINEYFTNLKVVKIPFLCEEPKGLSKLQNISIHMDKILAEVEG
ncbi:MAG TPA: ArsA family ATPase [Desulfurococcales archaeon]|nr:ArsA family ATPase [Desulfurococcales archaeon]